MFLVLFDKLYSLGVVFYCCISFFQLLLSNINGCPCGGNGWVSATRYFSRLPMFVSINLILVIHRADSSAPIRLLVVSNFFFLPQHPSLRSRFRSSFSHPWLRVFRRLSCNSLLAPRRFDTEGVRERERERERGGGGEGRGGRDEFWKRKGGNAIYPTAN